MKIGLRTVKTAVAAGLSMFLAQQIGLLYAPAAGIIAILSVGNTKKTSLFTGIGRLVSLAIATLLAFVSFHLLGFGPLGFVLFLFLFIPTAVYFKLTDGIVVNSVLVTHYMMERSFAWPLIGNAFLLMSIGIGFALLFNLYMPDGERALKERQQVVEETFKSLLKDMSIALTEKEKATLPQVCQTLLGDIKQGKQQAMVHSENQWRGEASYYEEYFTMRQSQARLLLEMVDLLQLFWVEEAYTNAFQELLSFTAESFHENNDGKEILAKIAALYEDYRQKPLPQTRAEFENRAQLFQFLQTFKSFIEIKADFSEQIQTMER